MPISDTVAQESSTVVLSERPAWQLVLRLCWPVLLQQVLLFAVNLYDALLAGRFRPETGDHVSAQSAQTTATYFGWLISSYTVLVSAGATALVARFTGANDRPLAVRATNQALLLAALLGLAGTLLGLLFVGDLLRLLGLEGDASWFAASYLRPLFALLIFQMVQMAGIACLVGAGDTRTGLWVLGSVALINMPLAWLFHQGLGPVPGLGFPGIALGTAISNTLGCFAVLVVLARGRAGLRLRLPLLRPEGALLRRLLRISVPAGFDSLIVAFGQLWFLSIVNRLSAAESGAHGIALRWEAISYLAGMAFATAAMTLVGQNLGAGRPDRAARSAWIAFALGCAVMSLCGLVFLLFAPQMFELFCPYEEQRSVVEVGVPVLRLIALAMLPLASCIVFTASLRGAGDTRVPVLFTLVGFFIVRIPLAYVLALNQVDLRLTLGNDIDFSLGVIPGLGLGLLGAWLAMISDVFVRGAFFLHRFAGGKWKGIEV